MTSFLRARLTGRRTNQESAPPLTHSWGFWHDRQERLNSPSASGSDSQYEDRLESLAEISDVKEFWSVFNNFDISKLKLRDSVHLFHKGVKPIWEDTRNARGGSWTFRVSTEKAQDFWKEVCMMAIGEQLQAAVEDPTRQIFRDDICGISLSIRTRAVLVQIWNRDGDHQKGIEAIRTTIVEGLSEELRPQDDRLVYYKKHNEHSGFGKSNHSDPSVMAAS
jgi:hypothetical protein